jgi:hypothetical protein
MKISLNLVKAIQGVDKNYNTQHSLLMAVRDMIMPHIAVLEEEIHHGKQMVETLEMKKKEAYENLAMETIQTRQS